MDTPDTGADLPAPERAIVGLCHGLNDQLAALNAYVFLLERRGALDESDAPLRAHLDRLAEQVRLVRSLARDPTPDVSPVAVSLLAEAASTVMEGYPEGPVTFEAGEGDDGSVVRCDWGRTLRALVVAGAWVSRGTLKPVTVEVEAEGRDALRLRATDVVDEPTDAGEPPATIDGDFRLEKTGPRALRLELG